MSSVYDGLTNKKPVQPGPIFKPTSKPGNKPAQPGPTNTGDTNMGKGILRSKTFWVNALMAAVSVGTYFQNSELLVSNPEVVAGIGTAIGIVNVILRLITKDPITSVK